MAAAPPLRVRLRHLLSLCLLLDVVFFLPACNGAGDYLKLRLLHPTPRPTPQQALLHDTHRLSVLFSSLLSASAGRRLPDPPVAVAAPVISGASTGAGQYFVDFRVGTPAQKLLLVADTGSDLVWVRCSACRDCSQHPTGTAFFARHSSTFAPYHCYDRRCRLVPHPRSVPCPRARLHSPCRYRYTYADHSVSAGFFSREIATLNASSGREIRLQDLAFGCGFNVSGPSVAGPAAGSAHGVMGLGRGPISFPSQVGRRYGNTFSYCLMDYALSPPPTSYLLIGDARENRTTARGRKGNASSPPLSYTPLRDNPLSPTFYYVGVEGATVDGVNLPIDSAVWALDPSTGAGGTVIDSGTTLTFLPEPAYRQILAAMERRVRLPRVAVGGAGAGSTPAFDLCVNATSAAGDGAPPPPPLPRLGLRLAGGALFSPPSRNYFVDAAPGVRCLALQPVAAPAGFGVIGNLMQQGFLFVFDRDRSRLGFSRTGCSA